MVTVPVNRRPRDWFAILRTLARHNISMEQIARICGKASSTVQRWQYGAEPRESDARIVLALLAKYAPDEYVQQQREFGVRLEIEATIQAGEQRRLGFVEVQ